jgi:hypothetical protein
MRDSEFYPEDWPEEVVDSLDTNSGWKRYFCQVQAVRGGDTIQTHMLDDWSVHHGALLKALDLILRALDDEEGIDKELGALYGLHRSLETAHQDLDDIIYFVQRTQGLRHPLDSEPTERPDKVVHLPN